MIRFTIREFRGRPKFRFVSLVALLWAPVALLAFALLCCEPGEGSPSVRWVCWTLVSIEPGLIVASILIRIAERPQKVEEHHVR